MNNTTDKSEEEEVTEKLQRTRTKSEAAVETKQEEGDSRPLSFWQLIG